MIKAARIAACSAIIAMLSVPVVHAEKTKGDSGSQLIGTVPLSGSGVTQNVYRQVDRLVPALRRLPADKIIKLECRLTGSAGSEQDVMRAFMLAGRIEKYLREHHKLNLDLWVTAHVGSSSKANSPSLAFSVFSDDIRNLEKLPVVPAKAQSAQAD